jgi:hypothetical protein
VDSSKRQLRSAASRSEILIPIRLELEHEAWKLRDTFTWNLLGEYSFSRYVLLWPWTKQPQHLRFSETDITPETFATHLCADLRLPERPFVKEIVTTIKKAIEDAQTSAQYDGETPEEDVKEMEETRQWFAERAQQRRRRPFADGLSGEGLNETESRSGSAFDEFRITIKVSPLGAECVTSS